jgi:hypothetical protein
MPAKANARHLSAGRAPAASPNKGHDFFPKVMTYSGVGSPRLCRESDVNPFIASTGLADIH